MLKSKIYSCIGFPVFLIGCSMIHIGLGIAMSGLLFILLSYAEFVEENEGE